MAEYGISLPTRLVISSDFEIEGVDFDEAGGFNGKADDTTIDYIELFSRHSDSKGLKFVEILDHAVTTAENMARFGKALRNLRKMRELVYVA